MNKRIIILLSAAVIITAAAFFAFKGRDSKPAASEAAVVVKAPDYLALETEEVIRIKKLRVSGYYKDEKPVIAAVEKTVSEKAVKKTVPVKKPAETAEVKKTPPKKTEPPEPSGPAPDIAVIQKTEKEISEPEEAEEAEEKSDSWTDKPLFELETPEDRSFYRKKVFISGKILDSGISSFSWKTEKSQSEKIETDYAGEFGFYVPTENLKGILKIYMNAVKDDGNSHDKMIVLFSRNAKPEIVIDKPGNNYEFGKYVTVEGRINIPGHEKYVSDLLKEAVISLSPAGYEDNLQVDKKGKFRYVADTSLMKISEKQNLLINVSLTNYKSGSASLEISRSNYDFVDYEITAGNSSITIDWDNIPVEAEYRISIKSQGSENKIISGVNSPLKLGSLVNGTVYSVGIEADEKENGDLLKGKKESVLPLDPASIKPSAEGFLGKIKIKWPRVKGTEKYSLFKKSIRSGRKEFLIKGFSGKSFTDENVNPAERYSYSVEPYGVISVRSLETFSSPSTGAESKIHEIQIIEEPDKIRDVLIINNYAYSICDNKVIISDITDINNPLYAGEIGEQADSLSVDEKYCYIVSEENGFVLYNISDPANPVQVVRREQYRGKNIWARFPYVYISEEEKGIRVLDIEDPEMPEKKEIYNGYRFSSFPVIMLDEQPFLTACGSDNNLALFNIRADGKLSKKHEVTSETAVLKIQSACVNNSIVTAALTEENGIILFNYESGTSDNTIAEKHLIKAGSISDFNFFEVHSGRSYLAVEKDKITDLYSVDKTGEPSFFTSIEKDNEENISFCNDNSGYAYFIKSDKSLELFRVMTEGISYVNNSFVFPGKVYDFNITDRFITALTENGIYSAERNSYFPESVSLSDGDYRQIWSTPSYTAAINKKYDYEIFPYGKDLKVTEESNGVRGIKAGAAEDYSVILNEDNEVLVFRFDITKNAPKLITAEKRNNIDNIFTFTDEGESYTGLISGSSLEVLKITENGFVKGPEIEINGMEKTVKIKCEESENSVNINIFSDNKIHRYIFSDGTLTAGNFEENSTGSNNLFGNLIIESEGEKGIGIYKRIDGKKILISRCSSVFSFDAEIYDGKLYSRGFNSVDEIMPVIPVWF